MRTSAPWPLRFEYDGIVPPGYLLQERPDLRFLVPGLVLFSISYAVSQLWLVSRQWNAWSLVPLAGPLVQIFVEHGSAPVPQSEFNIVLIPTVGQVVGLAAIIIGLAIPNRWLERSPVAVMPGPGGLALVGVF